jgi:2-keto-4-pentenoate hydratase/2-oxohepta-3-ene-1,7-dioic acid hydratase in catechol pathway
MKIFCIGRNYLDHIKELSHEVPDAPVVFMKPPTALLKSPTDFYLPSFSNNVQFEGEFVLKICKNGKKIDPKFAHRYYDEITVGIDFTARDLQNQLKDKGLPWEIAKAFDGSAVIGNFISIKDKSNPLTFDFYHNEILVQHGDTQYMMYSFDYIIHFVSQYFTLQQGDLIFTGTPAGVAKVAIGDYLVGITSGEKVLECHIR